MNLTSTDDIPRADTAQLPVATCDCHTHVFGLHASYPQDRQRTYTPGVASVEQMSALHRRLGVSRSVIVQPSPYGTDNRCTLDATRALNAAGRDAARAVVVPDARSSLSDLRAMHADGARGVRLNLETFGLHDPRQARQAMQAAAARIADLGWHIQLYTTLTLIEQMAETIYRLPVPVVFDHFAGLRGEKGVSQPGMSVLSDLLRDGKVYIKLSAAQRASRAPDAEDLAPIVRYLVETRSDRLLWGSDWPHPGAWPGVPRSREVIEPFHDIDDERALFRLVEWVRNPNHLTAILATNPAHLYGWNRKPPA